MGLYNFELNFQIKRKLILVWKKWKINLVSHEQLCGNPCQKVWMVSLAWVMKTSKWVGGMSFVRTYGFTELWQLRGSNIWVPLFPPRAHQMSSYTRIIRQSVVGTFLCVKDLNPHKWIMYKMRKLNISILINWWLIRMYL